ncbi:MAG: hypothetical protein C5B53_04060 [Candidatus Melainabacteria bacterium]|nr:MAG: hypothetical protein C5B53_04060 [Candidatus Melainabacteria bacterium]
MQPAQQFDLAVPPAVVKQRLETVPSGMAPKISTPTPGDEPGSFTCFITYANACALVKAKPQSEGKTTRVLVEIRSMTLWARPLGMLLTMSILLIGTLVDSAVFHAKTLADWCLFPGTLLVWIGINIALIPLSKRVLSQFIHDMLIGGENPSASV